MLWLILGFLESSQKKGPSKALFLRTKFVINFLASFLGLLDHFLGEKSKF